MSKVVESFYQAFVDRDAEKMVSYYADNVTFEDPAFGLLKGERAKNMWRMLIESQVGKKFDVQFSNVIEDSTKGTAHWEAKYKFSQTGRDVHNKIDAEFVIENGKIVKHVDRFSMHKWASQAMGVKGWLLGGTSFFKGKLNKTTNGLLDKYVANRK